VRRIPLPPGTTPPTSLRTTKLLQVGELVGSKQPGDGGSLLETHHPGGNPGANLMSISHRCYLFQVAFVWELTKETIVLPLGCLQGGCKMQIEGMRMAVDWRAPIPSGEVRSTLHPGGNPGANRWSLQSTPIQMPPESGGICGRLT